MNNDNVSEEYNLSLIKILFSSNEYYTITGIDPELGDDDIFLYHGKNILLFDNFDKLRNYINKEENLVFDKKNSKKWINNLLLNTIHNSYDFDLVETKLKNWTSENDILDDENQDFLFELFDMIAFAKDLKYQFFNKDIVRLLNLEEIKVFDDLLYDNFVWVSEDKSEVRRKLSIMMKKTFLVENLSSLLRKIYFHFLVYS